MTLPEDTGQPPGSKRRKAFDPYRYDAGTVSPDLQAQLIGMKVPLLSDEALKRPSSLDNSIRAIAPRLLQRRYLAIALGVVTAAIAIALMLPTAVPRTPRLAPKASATPPAPVSLAATPATEASAPVAPSVSSTSTSSASTAPNKRPVTPSKPNPKSPRPSASDDLETPFIHL